MWFKDLFYLRKSDRSVILVLMVMIVVAVGLIVFVGGNNRQTSSVTGDSLSSGRIGNGYSHRSDARFYYAEDGRKMELFDFDPNTADSTQLLRLGLAPWQVRSIYPVLCKKVNCRE